MFETYEALLEAADDPCAPDFLDRCHAVYEHIEAAVDSIPRDDREARDLFKLAADLTTYSASAETLTKLSGQAADTLILLRRMEREASQRTDDPFDPPLHSEARVLRSLIAYLARPVLVRE